MTNNCGACIPVSNGTEIIKIDQETRELYTKIIDARPIYFRRGKDFKKIFFRQPITTTHLHNSSTACRPTS